MSIQLQKGQKVDLTKGNAGLSKILVGLGWDVNRYDSGKDFDLDTSAFLLASDGKIKSSDDLVYYHNLKHASGSVIHSGDNLTGKGDGDDEQITVDLANVPAEVDKIGFTVAIYEAAKRRQNFGMVENAFIRIVSADTGEELLKYDLDEDYSTETAVIAGELYRHGGEWKFRAAGDGLAGGFSAVCEQYGAK